MIYLGDCISVMRGMDAGIYDGIITDPPYASGGRTIGERQRSTAVKYTALKHSNPLEDFAGETMDQRSWRAFMTDALAEAKRICKPGSPLVVFTDWRQLPTMTDVIQISGWTWRGIVVWDKVAPRPQLGRFRQQCEFVCWGSKGDMPISRHVPALPGVYRYTTLTAKTKRHQTEKPLGLMEDLMRIFEPGSRVLDPFAGSGTTLEAAARLGYTADGIEIIPTFYETAKQRVAPYIRG